MNILQMFNGDPELVWGTCSSPLIVDGKLIVNPGGPEASVVALDPESGVLIWQSPGARHAYSSFIVATLGGVRQLVGYDRTSLGGWDIATGNRLWTLKPPHDGDFNVPTPVAVDGRLLVATENNGARLYDFDKRAASCPQPVAENDELAPNVSSPAVVGTRVFCVCGSNVSASIWPISLKPIWVGEDDAFRQFVAAVRYRGSGARLWSRWRAAARRCAGARISNRLPAAHLFADRESRQAELLSFPALVGTRLFLRGERNWSASNSAPSAS